MISRKGSFIGQTGLQRTNTMALNEVRRMSTTIYPQEQLGVGNQLNEIKEEDEDDDEIYTDPELKEQKEEEKKVVDHGETSAAELPSPIRNLSSQLRLDARNTSLRKDASSGEDSKKSKNSGSSQGGHSTAFRNLPER